MLPGMIPPLPPLYILLTDVDFASTHPCSMFFNFLNLTLFPVHIYLTRGETPQPSQHLSESLNPCVTKNPLQAEHFGRLGRTGEASKQRGGSAPAADICRERVSCKIRARPTLGPADVWSGRIVRSGKPIALQQSFP